MKSDIFSLVLFSALIPIAQSAYGTQPPDVVNSDGAGNVAMGTNALLSLTTGGGNTAAGDGVLDSNTTGRQNSALGAGALNANTTGTANTATGVSALLTNTTGSYNTALGAYTLEVNTTGSNNTASGGDALLSNTVGSDNAAFGGNSLVNNTTGDANTATGAYALVYSTTGKNNTGSGYEALGSNTTGNANTAIGFEGLRYNTTGNSNIAVGYQAGYNLTTGSNNIHVGNVGVAAESNTIRIGTRGTHKVTVIAGIYGTPVSGTPVFVSATGRLGVTVSSERYKAEIASMGSNSEKLDQLRPVTFHLRSDPNGALQYGLIAEEVARVYPELVIRNESGRIDGIRYDELAPMLLNEMQKQRTQTVQELNAQAAEIHHLEQVVAETQERLLNLQSKAELVDTH